MWINYVERKISTALALADGECGGSYSDACILFSAMISGLAADLWPGKRIDKRRFVQVWTQFADPSMRPNFVSLPLLVQDLRRANRIPEAVRLEDTRPKKFGLGYGTAVLRGVEVDMSDAEILTHVPGLERAEVRRFSYPAVFYEHVRTSLSHEWRLSANASSNPMTRLPSDVSYVNRADRESRALSRRLIHFHIEWLAGIARSIAIATASMIENSIVIPQPQVWYLDESERMTPTATA